MEVEEGGDDGAGADTSERGGPGGEVSRPEAAQPRLTECGTTFRREIGDGVDGLDGDPEVAGGRAAPLWVQRLTCRAPVGELSG